MQSAHRCMIGRRFSSRSSGAAGDRSRCDIPNGSATGADDCADWTTEHFFESESVENVAACLAEGANPGAQFASDRMPLHLAARHNEHPAMAQALIAAGANPNALVAAGGKVRARDDYEQTPLRAAAADAAEAEVNCGMIAAGADTETRDASGGPRRLRWKEIAK